MRLPHLFHLAHLAQLVFVFILRSCLVESVLVYTIFEEQMKGTFVGDIVGDSIRLENYTLPSSASQLQFTILPGIHSNYFSVAETTGFLETREEIDREDVCAQASVCALDLEVALVKPVVNFHVFEIRITLNDVNDHTPTFDKDKVTISILESVSIGSDVILPPAKDLDVGIYSVQSYSLTWLDQSDPVFDLHVRINSEGKTTPYLILVRGLDREARSKYQFQMVAHDGGNPQNSGILQVEVNVLDVNDNSPTFDSSSYNITILENLEVSTIIGKVKATDKDEGPNGKVSYRFGALTKDLYGNIFQVHSTTGELSKIKNLGSGRKDVYNLLVVAEDQGVEPRSATANVYINIENVNSFAPEITVHSVSSSGLPEVMEGLDSGEFVAYVHVQDRDKGVNGEITCSVQGSNFTLREVHAKTFKLSTAVRFDREEASVQTVELECKDKAEPPKVARQLVEIAIMDRNDNQPQFTRTSYEVSVAENNDIGQVLLTVSASDADMGTNADIRFSIAQPEGKKLVKIDAQSGAIEAVGTFDYEERTIVQFVVIATAEGTPKLSSTASVTIRVLNRNDCTPTFSQQSFSFGIFENMPKVSEVGRISAVDCDVAPFNELAYEIRSTSDSNVDDTFALDRQNGSITTRAILDREATSVFYLTVLVIDVHDKSLVSTASVTIYVADRNDNAPVITYPKEGNDTVQVSSYAPVGFIVAKIQAYDLDISSNAALVYNITSHDKATPFDVDTNNGAIYLTESLRSVKAHNYRMLAVVTDRGQPSLSAVAVLNVQLNSSLAFAISQSLVSPDLVAGRRFDFGFNQKMIIILGATTGTLVLLLLIAIVIVRCRLTRKSRNWHGVDFNQHESASLCADPHADKSARPQISRHANATEINGGSSVSSGGKRFLSNLSPDRMWDNYNEVSERECTVYGYLFGAFRRTLGSFVLKWDVRQSGTAKNFAL